MKFACIFVLLVCAVAYASAEGAAAAAAAPPSAFRQQLTELLEMASSHSANSGAEQQANTATVASVQQTLAAADAATLGMDESAELVSTLHNLLTDRKSKDLRAQQQLSNAAQHTLQVEVDLKQKTAQLAKHSQMLDRLEACLTKGPPQTQMMQLREQLTTKSKEMLSERAQLNAAIAEIKARETSLLEKEQSLAARVVEVEKREAVMKQKEGALTSSVNLIQAREEAIKSREESLLRHMEDVSKTRQQMDEMMQTQIDQAVNTRIGAIKARLEKKHLEAEQSLRHQLEQRFQQVMAATKEAVGQTEDHHIALIQTQLATKSTMQSLLNQRKELEEYKGKLDSDHQSFLETHEAHTRSSMSLLSQLKEQQQALMLAKGQLATQQLAIEHETAALNALRKQQQEEAANLAKKKQEALQEEATFLSAVAQQKQENEKLAAQLKAQASTQTSVKSQTEQQLAELKAIKATNEATMAQLMKVRAKNALESEKLKAQAKKLKKQANELEAKKLTAEKQASEAFALTAKSKKEKAALDKQLKANAELTAKLAQQKADLERLNTSNQQLKQQTEAARTVTEQEHEAVARARKAMLKEKAALDAEAKTMSAQRKANAEQKAQVEAEFQALQKQKQQQAQELAQLLQQAAVFKSQTDAMKQQQAAAFVKKQAAQLVAQNALIHSQEQQLAAAKQQIAALNARVAHEPSAATPTGGMSLMQSQETLDMSRAVVVANATVDRCARYNNCGTCARDKACAWCAGPNGGSCMLHDVNAALRAGNTAGIGDGLTSGQCSADSWQSAVSARLTLLSLNVFASERTNGTRRLAAILKLIKKSGADVVTLQEVEKWFVQSLQAHPWLRSNYHFSDYGAGQAPGGLYILSRYPIASLKYFESIAPGQVSVSQRGRVLVAKIGIKNKPVYVATTNLDWSDANNRAHSLDFIRTVTRKYNHVFLTGDFNFDDLAEPETSHIGRKFLDLWTSLNPNKPGYTWDPRVNSFAKASDPLSRASRIDRIFLKSSKWLPRAVNLVGCSVGDLLCAGKIAAGTNATVTAFNPNPRRTSPSIIVRDTGADSPVSITTQLNTNFLELGNEIAAAQMGEHMAELSNMEDQLEMMELGSEAEGNNIPAYDPTFVPSNHFGLLVQASRFTPHC